MASKEARAWMDSLHIIKSYLNVSEVLPHITKILTLEEIETLNNSSILSNGKKIEYLTDMLPRKRPGWSDIFIEALQKTTMGTNHEEIIDILQKKLKMYGSRSFEFIGMADI